MILPGMTDMDVRIRVFPTLSRERGTLFWTVARRWTLNPCPELFGPPPWPDPPPEPFLMLVPGTRCKDETGAILFETLVCGGEHPYGLYAHLPWAEVVVDLKDAGPETSDLAAFREAARPWVDWALACIGRWTHHYGQVPAWFEPDPLARAELTGRWRQERRLLVPLSVSRGLVLPRVTCSTPRCLGLFLSGHVSLFEHAATFDHLASEFGVPVSELRRYRRAVQVAAELAR